MDVRGFTLLEVLIAISIFALIGLGSNAVLRTVVNAEDLASEVGAEVAILSRAMGMMERDFSQLTMRNINDQYGDPLPALMVNTGPHTVELTRSGWNNPAQLPRSSLQRVAYSINSDNELVRHFWLVLDRAQNSEPRTQVLFTDIQDFRVSLRTENRTLDQWPSSELQEDGDQPRLVQVDLTLAHIGSLQALYAIPALAPGLDPGAGGNRQDGNLGEPGGSSEGLVVQ